MKLTNEHWFEYLMTNKRARIFRHLLLQILLLFLSLNAFGSENEVFVFSTERLLAWLSFYGVLNLISYFNIYVLTQRLLLTGKTTQYILGVAGLTVILVLFILSTQTITEETEWQDLPVAFIIFELLASVMSIGLVIISTSSMALFVCWMKEQKRVSELKIATKQTELNLLKQQINPHFLFNMLNNANVLLKRAPEDASQVLFKLEELLNYQLNDSTKDNVNLDSDIHFLNDFLNLEKIRRDRFSYSITKNGSTTGVLVPPMLFIPFVENAIKHNPDNENESSVHITFNVTDDTLYFRCENSKPGRSMKANRTVDSIKSESFANFDKPGGLGLYNIRRRLALLYPERHELAIKDEEMRFVVELRIVNTLTIKNNELYNSR